MGEKKKEMLEKLAAVDLNHVTGGIRDPYDEYMARMSEKYGETDIDILLTKMTSEEIDEASIMIWNTAYPN